MRFKFTISHIPGKDLVTADALSRAPRRHSQTQLYLSITSSALYQHLNNDWKSWRLTNNKILCVGKSYNFCNEGWPDRANINGPIKPYLHLASEYSVVNGLLLRGSCIVVPTSLQLEIFFKLHKGHQGITKTRERARLSVWSPSLTGFYLLWVGGGGEASTLPQTQ